HVVRTEVDVLAVVRHERELRLHLRLVLHFAETAAVWGKEVEAWVLFALAIATHDEPLPVGRDRERASRSFTAGELRGESARAVDLPNLRDARNGPREVERFTIW